MRRRAHQSRAGPLLLLCAALACAKAQPLKDPGRTRFVLQPPPIAGLTSVDYVFRFFWLGALPAQQYGTYPLNSASVGSAVLPCKSDGGGLNEVVLDATLHYSDGTTGSGHAAALFTCVRESDTTVNLVVSVLQPGNFGDTDIGALATSTQCDSTAALRGDDALAVCASSTCGDSAAAFVFTNACHALDGSAPSYFACGPPADWTLLATLARAQIAVPPLDGTWTFSVAALGVLKLPAIDPTLTDASGNLRVWSGVATPRAVLQKLNGAVVQSAVSSSSAAFAALLDVPQSTQQTLLEVRQTPGAVKVFGWANTAACDRTAATFPGLFAADVRLNSLQQAVVYFATSPGGVISARATCTAALLSDGLPGAGCGPVGSVP